MTEVAAIIFLLTCAPFVLLALTLTFGGKFVVALGSLLFTGSPINGFEYILSGAMVSAVNAGLSLVDVLLYIWSEANEHPILALVFSGISVYLHIKLLNRNTYATATRTGLIDTVADFIGTYAVTCSLVIGLSIIVFGSLTLVVSLVGALRLSFVETQGTIVNAFFVILIILAFLAFILHLGKTDLTVHQMLAKASKHDTKDTDKDTDKKD